MEHRLTGAKVSRVNVAALDRSLVVLFEQDGTDEACDDGLFGEDADDVGAALDFTVHPFQRIRAVDLGAVLFGERLMLL